MLILSSEGVGEIKLNQFTFIYIVSFQVQGSSPPWPPLRAGSGLIAYPPAWKPYGPEAPSESATGCGHEVISTFDKLDFLSENLDRPGQG